jgi:CoA:oxalate CoA-transferase
MYVCGTRDREPLHSNSSQAEYNAGLYGFVGTMTALHARRLTGRGQHVDIAVMECMAGSHQFTLTWPAYSGTPLERPGWPGSVAPMGVYLCKDGYIVLRIMRIELAFLSHLFNMPALLEDPRFTDDEARLEHLDELNAIVTREIARLGKTEVFRACGEWREISGFVATVEDLLDDPHYREREFFTEMDHPYAGKLTYPGAPIKMTETAWKSDPAPLLGEHNHEIYCGRLGYAKDELVKLRETRVI